MPTTRAATSRLHSYLTSISAMITFVAFLGIYFPYISPIPTSNTDLQPIAVIFALLSIFLNLQKLLRIKLNKLSWIAISFLSATCFFAFIKFCFEDGFVARSFVPYLSLLIFPIFAFLHRDHHFLHPKHLFYVNLIWLTVGLIQIFFDPSFLYFLIRAPRTTIGRGVVSLAPEPSYYAIQMLLIIFLSSLLRPANLARNWHHKATMIIALAQMVFLAKSFTGLLFAGVFFTISSIVYLPTLMIPAIIFASALFYFSAPQFSELFLELQGQGRIYFLLHKLFQAPFELFILDQSGSERAADIVISLFSFIDNLPVYIGHPTSDWPSYSQEISSQLQIFKNILAGPRILSGLGAALFELGTMGLMIIGVLVILLLKIKKTVIASSLSLLIILFAAIPLATPLVGLIIGACLYSAVCTPSSSLKSCHADRK
jgi:hypothetical protein